MASTINMSTPYVTGQGGDDGAGSDRFNLAAGFSIYRTRGAIDINLNRLPTADDVTTAPSEDIIINDAFVCCSAGTPFSAEFGGRPRPFEPGYLIPNSPAALIK